MACYYPLKGWRGPKGLVTFRRSEGYGDLQVSVPCGRCIGCRLERARQWAVRCTHEAKMHEANCFITLTYADEHLPRGGSLDKYAVQGFLKRLRAQIAPVRCSYFYCGEYGDQLLRPHYHVLLFGWSFPDRKPFGKTKSGIQQYRSPQLEKLWPLGNSQICDFAAELADYVARYSLKKMHGEEAKEHYRKVDELTGEVFDLEPEFVRMSLRPAIGLRWLKRFHKDAYPSDQVIIRGREQKVPKFYDRKAGRVGLIDRDALKAERVQKWIKRREPMGERSPRRLEVKRIVREAKVNLRRRDL